ncbi:hypothetical protein [Sagittula sp. SSi028]|uniref:hypothetical protein n=1 Tax=Sagittula sp. SSi028 TaxID=3400636 RepID=UPI003AF81A1E
MLFLICALPLHAWHSPARGTADRADLMDAMRPHIEWIFGAPIVFVVSDLRVDGDAAFAILTPQRPDGRPLTRNDLRHPAPDGENPFDYDGASVQALLKRSGDTWVAVHWAIGATDVWWFWDGYCSDWSGVLTELC